MADAPHDKGGGGTIWEREVARFRGPEPRVRVSYIARIVLLLMGLVALVAIGAGASNYIQSVKSMSGLYLEITSLQVIDDDYPRAIIHFRLHNRSPSPVKVQSYEFTLYLNGRWVGYSDITFIAADPNVERDIYKKLLNVDQALPPDGHLDLEFPLYVYSDQMHFVRRVQGSDAMSWFTNATFRVLFPYAREEISVPLGAKFEE